MGAVRWTVSVDQQLLAEYKRICKERGRTQAYYVQAAMRRAIGDSSESVLTSASAADGGTRRGPSARRRSAKKRPSSHSE